MRPSKLISSRSRIVATATITQLLIHCLKHGEIAAAAKTGIQQATVSLLASSSAADLNENMEDDEELDRNEVVLEDY